MQDKEAFKWQSNQRKTAELNKKEKTNRSIKRPDQLTDKTAIINIKKRRIGTPILLILIIVSCLK